MPAHPDGAREVDRAVRGEIGLEIARGGTRASANAAVTAPRRSADWLRRTGDSGASVTMMGTSLGARNAFDPRGDDLKASRTRSHGTSAAKPGSVDGAAMPLTLPRPRGTRRHRATNEPQPADSGTPASGSTSTIRNGLTAQRSSSRRRSTVPSSIARHAPRMCAPVREVGERH